MSAKVLKSGIYLGGVRHRRFTPKSHQFQYSVYMMYLDLDELDEVLSLTHFWSKKSWRPVRFKREDYFGDSLTPLDQAVKNHVSKELNRTVSGPVRMLTNLRHFGFIINPITIYYCFDATEKLQAMMLEVTNTPWGERIQYVLDCDPEKHNQRISFNKAMHVSPFHPMTHIYNWRSNTPGKRLVAHLQNREMGNGNTSGEGENPVVFDATLSLERQEISKGSLIRTLLRHPIMTLKAISAIYWQALRLLLKKVPLHSHPNTMQ